MPDLLTRSAQHVWVEIRSGTPTSHTEGFYCLKCGQQAVTGDWSRTPMNSRCPQGDRVVDTSVLHRPPAPDPSRTPRELVIPGGRPPYPSRLCAVGLEGCWHPLLFHPVRRGFVLVAEGWPPERTWEELARTGFRLPMRAEAILLPMPRRVTDYLLTVAAQVDDEVHGLYWDVGPGPGGTAYHFAPWTTTRAA